jgi:hypothetical protein
MRDLTQISEYIKNKLFNAGVIKTRELTQREKTATERAWRKLENGAIE